MSGSSFKLNFVGIGAKKTATTWLYQCLKEHPEVQMAPKDQGRDALFSGEDYEERIERCSFFSQNSKKKGEFRVGYLFHPEVVSRMESHNPDLKIIVSLRDPVKRAYSDFLANISELSNVPEQFSSEIRENSPRVIERSLYFKHLKRYFEYFPEENISVVFLRDIKEGPGKVLQNVYEFLGVDSDFVPEQMDQEISASKFRMTRLGNFTYRKLIQILKKVEPLWRLRNAPVVRRTFYKFTNFYSKVTDAKKPSMKEEDKEYLYELFREDIKNLEDLLGVNLNHWKLE